MYVPNNGCVCRDTQRRTRLVLAASMKEKSNLPCSAASNQPAPDRFIMPGVRPRMSDRPMGRFSYRLKPFAVPSRLRDILALPSSAPHALMETRALLEEMAPSLCQPQPTMTSFVARWSILLFAEEVQEEADLRQFDIPSTTMQRKGDFLALKVRNVRRTISFAHQRLALQKNSGDQVTLHFYLYELQH